MSASPATFPTQQPLTPYSGFSLTQQKRPMYCTLKAHKIGWDADLRLFSLSAGRFHCPCVHVQTVYSRFQPLTGWGTHQHVFAAVQRAVGHPALHSVEALHVGKRGLRPFRQLRDGHQLLTLGVGLGFQGGDVHLLIALLSGPAAEGSKRCCVSLCMELSRCSTPEEPLHFTTSSIILCKSSASVANTLTLEHERVSGLGFQPYIQQTLTYFITAAHNEPRT